MKFSIIIIFIISLGIFAEDLFFIERGDTIFLTSPNGGEEANSSETNGWFTTQFGQRVKISEGIIVELTSQSSAKKIFSIPAIKSYEQLSGNIFLVIPTDKNNQFALSREFLKNEFVVHSSPNLTRERRAR